MKTPQLELNTVNPNQSPSESTQWQQYNNYLTPSPHPQPSWYSHPLNPSPSPPAAWPSRQNKPQKEQAITKATAQVHMDGTRYGVAT